MRYLAIIVAASISTPCLAQQTNCRWMGSIWSCDTQAPPPQNQTQLDYGSLLQSGGDAVGSYERARRLREEDEQMRAQTELIKRQSKAQAIRDKVGKLASEGKCDDARKAALAGGEIELAKIVMEVCTPG